MNGSDQCFDLPGLEHADVGVGALTVTPERESVVDFTRRYLDRGLAMTVRETKDSVDLFSCLMAFRPLLWAGVALSAIIVALVLQRLNGSCSNISTGHAASSSLSSWASSLWLVFGSLMQQGGEPLLTSISARVMLAVWWFFTLIVVSSYTASLAAFLTLSRLTTPIGSLQELVRQTDVTFGTVLHSALYEQLRMRALNPASPEHSTYVHLWTTVSRNNGSENCVRDVAEGLARVKRGGYIFLWDTAVLEHEALNDGDCALSVRNVAYDKGYSLALQQGSPYRDIFSQRLLELQESGELEALRQKWWPRQTGKCDPYGSPMSPARPQGLDLPGLAGAFALLAAGLLLACLLGACELCWSSRPHHLCPPKVQEDKELEMQQVRQRLGSVERLHEMAAASRKPLALLPGESPCDPDSPAEHGREYRTLGFAIGSFLMDDKATGRPMAVGGPGPSMTGSQPPSQPPPPLPVPLCSHSITEPLLGHGKQRAPNGGLQRQSPLKAFGRTSFHMPVDYISEGLCEPLHGTSI
uniref:Ionotropic glutamate receptor C-terminal domain-containing protein n=2 Tax=Eptatretus burgeri TaxID=7764 RepID=A0A8C4QTH3_EPTBU